MRLNINQFLECIEKAKQKMKAIEQKCHPISLIYAIDVIDRTALAIRDEVEKKIKGQNKDSAV